MQEHPSTYLANVLDWRYWLDWVYQYGRIPVFVVFVAALTLIVIYLARLFQEAQSARTEIRNLVEGIQKIQTLITDGDNRLVGELSGLHESINKHAEQQRADHKALHEAKPETNNPPYAPAKTFTDNAYYRVWSDELKPPEENRPTFAPAETLTDDAESSQFPASVNDYLCYLDRNNSNRTQARSDLLHGGNLISASHGEFIVILDGRSQEKRVVPHIPRFSSGEEFSVYFGDFFDCDAPSAGEVWITRPAFVQDDETKGGWRVVKKGLLEIRQ